MPTKTAKTPKISLTQMIDQRLDLERKITALVEAKDQLTEQIVAEMKAQNRKSAMGDSGEGYRHSSWMQADFKPEAVEYIRRIKKEHLFVPEPMVTKARLRDAFQNGHLTATQHDRIKSFAGPDYPVHRLYKIEKGAKDV